MAAREVAVKRSAVEFRVAFRFFFFSSRKRSCWLHVKMFLPQKISTHRASDRQASRAVGDRRTAIERGHISLLRVLCSITCSAGNTVWQGIADRVCVSYDLRFMGFFYYEVIWRESCVVLLLHVFFFLLYTPTHTTRLYNRKRLTCLLSFSHHHHHHHQHFTGTSR